MRPQRQRQPRFRRRTILLYCEGRDTEPIYLRGLCQEQAIRDRFHVTIREGGGGAAHSIVREAKQERDRQKRRGENYEEVWCVLDVEDMTRAESLNEAVQLAEREKIRLFLSNPSFEVWLIAHFECIARAFLNSAAAEKYLEQTHWRKEFGTAYDKSDESLYTKLSSRRDTATANAQWVLEQHHQRKTSRGCNSSTEIYRLVNHLRAP